MNLVERTLNIKKTIELQIKKHNFVLFFCLLHNKNLSLHIIRFFVQIIKTLSYGKRKEFHCFN